MDNAAVRESVKAALDTISGITGYVRRPRAVKPGDGWPVWRGAERGDGFAFVQTFAVVIALAGDEESADRFVDEHGEALADALEAGSLYVQTMMPAVTASDAGDLNALMITGRTE